jgi:hypothetical protein
VEPSVPDLPPSDHDEKRNAFDEFVNNDLNMDGLGEPQQFDGRPGTRSAERFPDDLDGDDEPHRDEPQPPSLASRLGGAEFRPPSSRPVFTGRPPFEGQSLFPFPSLDDPRWQRGVYEVVKDLRIHKAPVFLPPTPGNSQVLIFSNAYRYPNKSLRFIPNVVPGWSAVHLLWDKPVTGYVHQNEVRLMPKPHWLQEKGLDVILIVCMCLVVLLALLDIARPSFDATQQQVDQLQATMQIQQTRISELEATLNAPRRDE